MLKNNILNKPGSILIMFVMIFSIVSCTGKTSSSDQAAQSGDDLNKDELTLDVQEVIYPLPAPFEITSMLNDIGATYNSGILNTTDNVEKYFTEQSKAVNLGIFGADLSYASTYEQQEDIQLYLETIRTLADQLGVNVDYAKLLSDEYKEKFNNKDSLTNIITNTFYDTYGFLDQKSNPDLSVSMVTGMWVELMYIATHISEDSYNFTGIVELIVNQKSSYEKVMELLNSRSDNADISELATTLQVLQPVFDQSESGLSEEDYELILETIQSVRASIIS